MFKHLFEWACRGPGPGPLHDWSTACHDDDVELRGDRGSARDRPGHCPSHGGPRPPGRGRISTARRQRGRRRRSAPRGHRPGRARPRVTPRRSRTCGSAWRASTAGPRTTPGVALRLDLVVISPTSRSGPPARGRCPRRVTTNRRCSSTRRRGRRRRRDHRVAVRPRAGADLSVYAALRRPAALARHLGRPRDAASRPDPRPVPRRRAEPDGRRMVGGRGEKLVRSADGSSLPEEVPCLRAGWSAAGRVSAPARLARRRDAARRTDAVAGGAGDGDFAAQGRGRVKKVGKPT